MAKNEPDMTRELLWEENRDLKQRNSDLLNKISELEQLNARLESRIEDEIETTRRQEQVIMRQAGFASMGQLIGAIAHQWRQPLTTIGLIVQKLKRAYQLEKLDGPYLDRSVKEAMAQVRHMSETIENLRAFLKPSKEKIEFDVPSAISETLSILNAQFSNSNIRMSYRFNRQKLPVPGRPGDCEPVKTVGFPNEFKQVLINIINNAVSAISRKKETGELGSGGGEVSIDIETDDKRVKITIANNGLSMPDDVLERLFEPLFSPHRVGKTIGVGLYMTRVIIEHNMGGRITARNTQHGAAFDIKLSLAQSMGDSS